LGNTGSKNAAKSEEADKTKNASDSSGANSVGAFSGGVLPGSSSLKIDSDSAQAEKDRLAAEKEAADKAAAEEAALLAKAPGIEEYDLKNDINQDKDVSIFDQISSRYQKSYRKLFSQKK
jgi:hypothetical protein